MAVYIRVRTRFSDFDIVPVWCTVGRQVGQNASTVLTYGVILVDRQSIHTLGCLTLGQRRLMHFRTCKTHIKNQQECFAGIGILFGGAIMVSMAPLVTVGCRGHVCLASAPAPLALAASGLVAAYFGGWSAVWAGLPTGAVIAVLLGWCVLGDCYV